MLRIPKVYLADDSSF